MRLRIVTPLDVVLDENAIASLRAEDASGGFGIQPGHADFLTVLAIGVLGWRCASGAQRYCAVRRGVLTVSHGQDIAVATREAVLGDDLAALETTVLARFRAEIETERGERRESTRLQLDVIRHMVGKLKPVTGNPGLTS